MAAQVQPTPGAASAIPVRSIRVGANNPRRHFDPAAQAELLASVRDRGVLIPILVRPAPPGKDGAAYELVAGERRLRAAREAGLETIPAVVRPLTDADAFEVALIENLQRDNLSPLDEARGYERLQHVHRHSLEDIALKVAKSKGYVLARLKLLGLPEPAKDALAEGTLQLSTALLIARIPNQKLAGEATSAVLGVGRAAHDGPMSHARAARFIRDNYMLSLRGAPFPIADATLVPEAGACAACPKRTGNQRDLFGGTERDDVCLDPQCFGLKKEAAWRRACEQAPQRGHNVLAERQTHDLFGAGGKVVSMTFVDLDAACPHDPKQRTWRRLLGKHVPKPLHLARDEDGRIHTLLATTDAARALRETGHKFPLPKAPEPVRITEESMRQQRAQERRESHMARAIVNDALAAVVARVEAQEPTASFWRLVTEALAAGSWHDTIVDVVKRRGWAAKGTRGEETLLKQATQLGPAPLRGLVVELLVSKHAHDTFTGKVGRMLRRACEVFGVDLSRIQAKQRAARKKEKKEKAAGATKRGKRRK